jgi:hypothetical protein
MDKRIQTTRYIEDTMEGKLSVTFNKSGSLYDFCQDLFADFDPLRFDIVAARLYYSGEIIFTVYAVDKTKPDSDSEEGILKVKKFKAINPSLTLLLNLIREFNFTITNREYHLEEIEVINK